MENYRISTGLPGLDHIVRGMLPGDNVVWQVNSIEDFLPFVKPYCQFAQSEGKRLIYFRFGSHRPLVGPEDMAEVHELNPDDGFETFLFQVHRVIGEVGRGAYYIFDCLSELVKAWHSDQMLANFFLLTCPYLYDLRTLTYFPILGHEHSYLAKAPIAQTTQLLINVYRHKGKIHIHPIKVQHRYSQTMCMLHSWEGDQFTPVSDSATISATMSLKENAEQTQAGVERDVWSRAFSRAKTLAEDLLDGKKCQKEADECRDRLLEMAITRDERMLNVCKKYFTLHDLLQIGERMIGAGHIGGKALGMLLARAILARKMPRSKKLMEMHDSFYLASDVFYTYLVQNGCWWVRETQRDPETFLRGASEARRQILRGVFPDLILTQISEMLDYFGQSPIIVRSSSLLEDNFGNAFAGKYDSVFCANQGPRTQRLEDVLAAVRSIYASSMSEDALRYRARRGLLEKDERMSLLIQRVSGSQNGDLFYPQFAGVGFSFNPFAWSEKIDPEAGVVRLVFGLGTRAVDQSGDYTRIVALNAPERRPEESLGKISQATQRKIDVLDFGANQLVESEFSDVLAQSPQIPLKHFCEQDLEVVRRAKEQGKTIDIPWLLTFRGLLHKTPFVADIREMLRCISEAYDYPVDIEFTGNFTEDGACHINLLQCRPLQIKGGGRIEPAPADLSDSDYLLRAHGAVIGHSRIDKIDRMIYVVPSVYSKMPLKNRYSVARLIGEIFRLPENDKPKSTMLLGPGRWGTSTPSLGVPVSFAEISNASILCEIVDMGDNITPDVSLGTHFFSEIVEMDTLYTAMFPDRDENFINEAFFLEGPNKLKEMFPDISTRHLEAIKIIDAKDLPHISCIRVNANALKQEFACYLESLPAED